MLRMNQDVSEVLYTPDSQARLGFGIWKEMVLELVRSRELIWRFFLRDISARYRQSVFGYFWAVMPAVVTVTTFTYLNRSRILPIGETEIPYPAYVVLGMTVWQLFATGLTTTTQSLVTAGPLITKINFSRETLIFAAFGQSVFDFLIRLILVAGVFIWFRIVPTWAIILVPFALIPLALLTIGLGFISALANGVFRDVGNGLAVLITFAMFLAPVVYPAPREWPALLINYVNPVSPFIIATQDLTTKGILSQPEGLLLGCVIGVFVFIVGWRIFCLAMPRIAERL